MIIYQLLDASDEYSNLGISNHNSIDISLLAGRLRQPVGNDLPVDRGLSYSFETASVLLVVPSQTRTRSWDST